MYKFPPFQTSAIFCEHTPSWSWAEDCPVVRWQQAPYSRFKYVPGETRTKEQGIESNFPRKKCDTLTHVS